MLQLLRLLSLLLSRCHSKRKHALAAASPAAPLLLLLFPLLRPFCTFSCGGVTRAAAAAVALHLLLQLLLHFTCCAGTAWAAAEGAGALAAFAFEVFSVLPLL